MWTPKKLEEWKVVSGKTWERLAEDQRVGDRYLRKIRSGERKGTQLLERVERSERASAAGEAADVLQQKLGMTRKELAEKMGVGERHLRRIVSGERISLPTVEKLFGEVARQGVEIPRIEFFFKDLAINRIGKILFNLMPTWKGMRKADIIKIAAMFMEDINEKIQYEAWKMARDLYDKSMGIITA